jgi:hypothetical protein
MTAKRVDQNQAEIVQAMRDLGASVVDLHEVGKGCPDLLVGYRGFTVLIEIKMPGEKRNKRQLDWFALWRGGSAVVIETAAQAVDYLMELEDER